MLEILSSEVFLEAAFGDLVEELAAADVLHDEVDLGFGGHDFEELDDVRVADAAEDGDLALDVGDEAALEDLLLVDDLDGDALTGLDVARVVHLREGSVAQELSYLEAAQEEAALLVLVGNHHCLSHHFFSRAKRNKFNIYIYILVLSSVFVGTRNYHFNSSSIEAVCSFLSDVISVCCCFYLFSSSSVLYLLIFQMTTLITNKYGTGQASLFCEHRWHHQLFQILLDYHPLLILSHLNVLPLLDSPIIK
ncbi:hypothetical protein Ahy_B03g061697 [Arachis hypogaea]|uniref:Uncharacterized protein n=1 Tax=Arachis hypogaea TaxID=3818 RepID=A0A444ZRI1_ARAHY|nr:hypothetical protein Ahy_B03g061697 [Arachis hypogaea]